MGALREKLIKIGAKVVRQAKEVTYQMAEVPVPRELFAAILERIQRFGVPPPLVQRLMLCGNGPEALSRKRQRPG